MLFPDVTQLDLTGPAQILSRLGNVTIDLVAKTADPVMTDAHFALTPTATFADCARLVQPSVEYDPAPPFDFGYARARAAGDGEGYRLTAARLNPDRDARRQAVADRLGLGG